MSLRRLVSCSIAIGTSFVGGIASAQTLPVKAPPVEVVATRVAEAPHDVPAALEVINGDELRARGATTLRDALSLASGLAIAPGGDQGPASAVPEFWGVREFDAFLLVVDDVPWGGALNPAVATVSLRDVERIEILRGPAPVTYGATSFVGVVHVVHKPSAATARYAEAHGGNFGTGGIALDASTPGLKGWQSRLSADFDRQGFRDEHTSYMKGHGLWRTSKITDAKRMWLTADLNILMQDPASPHPRSGATLDPSVPLDANHNPADAYVNENRFAVNAGYERPLKSGATWGTVAAYTFSAQRMFRGFLTAVSNTANNAAGFKETIDVNDLYADTHIIWPVKNSVRFMAGADMMFAAGEGKGATFTYTAPLDGSSQAVVPEPATLDKDSEDERRFLGAYGSAEWKPISRLSFSAGLRFNSTAERRGEGEEVVFNKFSGGVGTVIGLWENGADHLRWFANVRSTFKPAAFDFGLVENEGVLDPETSLSYESGLKIQRGRFDAEASWFYMDFKNLVTTTTAGTPPVPILQNTGSTRFKGADFATDVELPASLFLRGTYSIHDGRFVDFVQDFGGTNTQLAGKRFEMSAKKLASAGLLLAPERGFIANVNMNYSGDRYLNKRNTALAPAFTTFDAAVGFRTGKAEFRIDGRNLTNERDAISESEFGDAQYYRMPAATFRTSVVVRY